MNRNDRVMVGELKEGDRFCYHGKRDVWQVMKQDPAPEYNQQSYTYINRFDPQGRKLDVFDTKKKEGYNGYFFEKHNLKHLMNPRKSHKWRCYYHFFCYAKIETVSRRCQKHYSRNRKLRKFIKMLNRKRATYSVNADDLPF